MSTDASDDELVTNFETVKTCLRLDCAKLLRGCLICFFPKIDVLKRNISENVKEGSREAVGKCKSIKSLSFQVLCDIFLCGTCNKSLLPPSCGWNSEIDPAEDDLSVSANILRLWRIWKTHISENTEEKLTDNDTNAIWSKLHQIGAQLSSNEDFHIVGGEFIESIKRRNKNDEDLPPNAYTQLGSGNSMGINIGAQTENSISCCQVGVKNKLIFQIEDQRQLKQLEIETSGKTLCRIVARAPLTPVWQQIKDNVCRLNPTALNDNDTLKENCISFEKIEKGCLVIDVTLKNKDPLEENLQRIFQVLYDEGDLENVMQKHNTEELTISGYIYCPENYIRDDSRSTCKRKPFSLKSHHTLFLGKSTTCDVDLFMSELLEKLMENEFSTDANEVIKLEIKGEVIDPNNYSFSSLQQLLSADTEERSQQLNSILSSEHNICVAKIFNVKNTTVIHVVLKSGSQMNYRNLVEESGILFTLLRNILWSKDTLNFISEIRLMRIGLIADTSMIDEITSEDKGLVFYLTSESKISEAIENGTMTDILTAMLQGEDPDILKNAGELKIKAIIESELKDDTFMLANTTVDIEKRIEVACDFFRKGNFRVADGIARNVYDQASSMDVDSCRKLLMIFDTCEDHIYSMKCFYLVKLLDNLEWSDENVKQACLHLDNVTDGQHDFKAIQLMLLDVQHTIIKYLQIEESERSASNAAYVLTNSYREVKLVSSDNEMLLFINKQLTVFVRSLCQALFDKGDFQQICEIYKTREFDELDAESFLLWAEALKKLDKIDIAIKKVREGLHLFEPTSSDVVERLQKFEEHLLIEEENLMISQTKYDETWLEDTNIKVPQQMSERSRKVLEDHVKRPLSRRRKKRESLAVFPGRGSKEETRTEEDTPKTSTREDAYLYKFVPTGKRRRLRRLSNQTSDTTEDFNVVEFNDSEISDTDSGQDSYDDSDWEREKPFLYEDPEYSMSEAETFTDSGFDTIDDECILEQGISINKTITTNDLVMQGIKLTLRCEAALTDTDQRPFPYQKEKTFEELQLLYNNEKDRYKRCSIEIVTAHKAICRNLDVSDEIKEIIISGRSKCGRCFTDDEVLVEVLGKSKKLDSPIPRLKSRIGEHTADTSVYGAIIGILKRNRYRDIKHPILVCVIDDYAKFMMKPRCKTVPKVKISHQNCKHNFQVDLFSYDEKKHLVEFRETLCINQSHKNSYCFLVAIVNWTSMYPFGVTLKVMNTLGDLKSGISILRLQHRVPGSYSIEAETYVKSLLKKQSLPKSSEFESVFTVTVGDKRLQQCAFSAVELDAETYKVGIHIANPAREIKKGDDIDKEAHRRGTDYEIGGQFSPILMIPEILSRQIFCFQSGEVRKALSVYISIHQRNPISKGNRFEVQVDIRETNVLPVKEITIQKMQELLKNDTSDELEEQVKILRVVSKCLREKRLENSSRFTSLKDSGVYLECMDAYVLYEELLLQANHEIAKFVYKSFPDILPVLIQPAPQQNVIQKWKENHDSNVSNILINLQDCKISKGLTFSISNLGKRKETESNLIPIQKCVWEKVRSTLETRKGSLADIESLVGADEIHPLQALALEEWNTLQTKAEWKCSSSEMETCHFTLRLSIYTTATSPLSRYIDLLVHRLLHAILDGNGSSPYTKAEVTQICYEMNEIYEQESKFCSEANSLLLGHSLSNQPQMFHAFVQNVTNNDVELFYPVLRTIPRLSRLIPIGLLCCFQKPEFLKETHNNRNIMTVKWQSRIYSLRRKTRNPPKENVYLRLNPHPLVKFQTLTTWANIIKALGENKIKNTASLLSSSDKKSSKVTVPECRETVNDVCSELKEGLFLSQFCKYSLSFNFGQVLRIQMSADPIRGDMIPLPQLVDLTSNVKHCLQHARDPVGVLSAYVIKSTKDSYSSCKEYVRNWIPILSMEVATQTVQDDSITIANLPVTFTRQGGFFSLKKSYLEQRDIHFTAHPIDMFSSEVDKKKQQKFYMSGSDFLCIRLAVQSNKPKMSAYGNGAILPPERYWVGHAKVHDIIFKAEDRESRVKVIFMIHNSCPPIPENVESQKKECHVEILPKSDVNRRTELYVKWLESASELAKAIAERRTFPALERDHAIRGDKLHNSSSENLDERLNKFQSNAVKNALTSSFSLIQGPPGTGKTFTGVALIKLFCNINKMLEKDGKNKKYVIFCGPSNKSVDVVTGYLMKTFGYDLNILRVYGNALECYEFPVPGKVFTRHQLVHFPDPNIKEVSLHHVIRKPGKPFADRIKTLDKRFKTIKEEINYEEIRKHKEYIADATKLEIKQADVILCTTSVATSARLLNATKQSIYQLLIDEAGMCTEPECMAVIVATQAKQVVLIGDHKQLQPVILCQKAADLGLQNSLFERYAKSKPAFLTFLSEQYRMHPNLCSFPSKIFYENNLKTNDSSRWKEPRPLELWRKPDNPFVFCHIEGTEEYLPFSNEEGKELSRFNMDEVDVVERVFNYMTKHGVLACDINIMSQYNAQCSKIKTALQRLSVQNVNTVVASQGGEWDYVIFSLVRSLPYYRIEPNPTPGWCKENLGFITDVHQINVALTRARKGLVIIGNKNLMNCDPVFKQLIEHYGRHGCVEDATHFPPPRSKERSHSRQSRRSTHMQ